MKNKKKKNKNLNLIRKVVKSYKEDKSPTDVLNKSFRKHDSNYKKIMSQSWGNKDE